MFPHLARITSENLFNNTVHLLEYFLHFLTKETSTGLNFISFNFPYSFFLSPLNPSDKTHTCAHLHACTYTHTNKSR